MIDVKNFSGIMNTDDKEIDVVPNQHINGRNIRFFGGSRGLSVQNVKGNYLIANSNLPNGTNECIGAFYDSINREIYFFNYNQYGNHGIYKVDVRTDVVTQVFRCGVNSATDILSFSLDYPIASAVIVYRTEGEGNLLYWTDGLNRPRFINLDTVATLGTFTEEMLNAARRPPLDAPSVSYTTDASYNANRVKNKYFQFAYRWVYKNFEKSTFSPWSVVPIPSNIVFPNEDILTNTNNAIGVTVTSATTEDFDSIEVIAREWLGTAWGDAVLINTITDADVATPLPWSLGFNFFNNGTYVTVPTDDTDLYYDHLPDKANTLELLNGNVIIYGGITEGYDNILRQDVDVQITTSRVNSSFYPAVSAAFKWNQYYRFGIQYYDKYSKPIGGVVSFLGNTSIDTTNFDITTDQYGGEINGSSYLVPKIFTTINHVPPQDAESYQWVRQDLVPSFLQWVTNDYQTDNEYSYLCIQSLIDANTKNGFLPSYEFTSGDRLRVLGAYSSSENAVAYVSQPDVQILDIVQRVMSNGNPAVEGAFIKVRKPSTLPNNRNQLIEIYTPPNADGGLSSLFYEWGERYGLQTIDGVKYHLGGTQNQTASLPALTEFTEGDVYLKSRQIYPTIDAGTYTLMVMDKRYNDYQQSAANSNGRAWLIDAGNLEQYNGVLVRWGGEYQAGNSFNNLNRFRPNDYDEADRAKGDIRRFKARDRILRVFQDRGVGQWGVYTTFVRKNEGEADLLTTNEIITQNNVQYYQGNFGLGGYPTNLCSSPIADYFNDVVTGREIRLSGDGNTDLGMLYKGQFYLSALASKYNKNITRSNGSKAKIIKFWNSFESEAHTVLQAGTDNVINVSDYNYSFNEPRNGFTSFFDYAPDFAISADDILYSWKNGFLYKHEVSGSNYCTFYGVLYNASITVVFNPNPLEKKTWQSMTQVGSDIWASPTKGDIYTSSNTYGTQRQESHLVAANYTTFEGQPSSAFFRDEWSRGGWVNGDFLKGEWVAVKLVKQNASNLVTLSVVSAQFADSPLTSK